MPGAAAPYSECPERLRLVRNSRSVRNGCALAGRDDAGGDATQRNCVERWLIDGGRSGCALFGMAGAAAPYSEWPERLRLGCVCGGTDVADGCGVDGF